jgi:hypothetical protein
MCKVEGETENLVRKEMIFNYFALSCMSIYISLYGAMTPSNFIFHPYTKALSIFVRKESWQFAQEILTLSESLALTLALILF